MALQLDPVIQDSVPDAEVGQTRTTLAIISYGPSGTQTEEQQAASLALIQALLDGLVEVNGIGDPETQLLVRVQEDACADVTTTVTTTTHTGWNGLDPENGTNPPA